MLFSERSIWTMVHGIGLGGGALIGLAAALFYLFAARSSDGAAAPPGSGALAGVTVLSDVLLSSAESWAARRKPFFAVLSILRGRCRCPSSSGSLEASALSPGRGAYRRDGGAVTRARTTAGLLAVGHRFPGAARRGVRGRRCARVARGDRHRGRRRPLETLERRLDHRDLCPVAPPLRPRRDA